MQLKEISFEIIQRCPNNCIYCSSISNCQSKKIINLEIFKKTIVDAISLGLERVCISGGEPFLHPDIIEFVKFSKELNLEVFVYTSGIVFNSAGNYSCINKDVLRQLKEAGLDRLIYNVQSSDENSYNSIMGTENCFDLMKTSINHSVEMRLFSEIHFVPMKINYRQVHSVLEMAKELGISRVSFLRLVIQGRAMHNKNMVELSKDMEYELKNILTSLEEKCEGIDIRIGVPLSNSFNYGCNASLGKLIIRYDGAVFLFRPGLFDRV